MISLSVLDQSVSSEGKSEGQSIRDTIELSQLCETLGYKRFWVSEHHNHPTIVGPAPEVIMAAIAQATDRIRIGSAGIMLPHYAPFKVAEQFRVLDAIAPGRIDLGLGRAPGSDGKTGHALNPNGASDSENFPANVRDLMAWVSGQPLIDGHPYSDLKAHPTGNTSPEIWILGTSDYGARVAAHFGVPYCFAHFIQDGHGVEEALDLYREHYCPSDLHPEPKASVCVWALAADTEKEAMRLFSSRAHWKVRRESSELLPIQSPDAIEGYDYTEREKMKIEQLTRKALIGSADQVAAQLVTLAEKCRVDEIAVLTWTHAQSARRRSYKLLSDAFNL